MTSACNAYDCWEGHSWPGDGITVGKPAYIRLLPKQPQCRDYQDSYQDVRTGGFKLCYDKCPIGCKFNYNGFEIISVAGAVCWCTICPTVGTQTYVGCGLGCAFDDLTCGLILTEQITSVLFEAASIASLLTGPGAGAAEASINTVLNFIYHVNFILFSNVNYIG